MSKLPPFAVAECGVRPLFVQVTVSPTWTVIVLGRNLKSSIVTEPAAATRAFGALRFARGEAWPAGAGSEARWRAGGGAGVVAVRVDTADGAAAPGGAAPGAGAPDAGGSAVFVASAAGALPGFASGAPAASSVAGAASAGRPSATSSAESRREAVPLTPLIDARWTANLPP